MVNYSNEKVYKVYPIVEHLDHEIYIGSTTKIHWSQRMDNHRSKYKKWKSGTNASKLMAYDIFDKYGVKNCKIELIGK